MTSVYFVPLLSRPEIVAGPGRYRTRAGEVVSVDAVGSGPRPHAFDCRGAYADGTPESWHRSGRILATSETANDIVATA